MDTAVAPASAASAAQPVRAAPPTLGEGGQEPASAAPAMRPLRRRGGFPPALALFFLAPMVGEVLAGSTSLDMLGSPAIFLVVFLLEALLYGGGAVLIRELARRAGRGWPTILGLGLAYGVLEEGLITQSFFNPDYLGLHLLSLGNLFGLGWVWITDLLPLHAVWSGGVPIALAELLFRDRGAGSWLGRPGLTLVGLLFAAGAGGMWLATYASEPHFLAPWAKLLGALVVTVAAAGLAMRLPGRAAGAASPETEPVPGPWPVGATRSIGDVPNAAGLAPAPGPWPVGAAAFVAASLFMGVHQLYSALPDLPGIVPVAVTPAVALAMLGLVLRWSARPGWGAAHRLALAAGALFTHAWNGFFTIPLGDRLDVAGQVIADALAAALVVGLAVSLSRERSRATGGAHGDARQA